MKNIPIGIALSSLLLLSAIGSWTSVAAQVVKPKPSRFIGKELPAFRGDDEAKSPWLGGAKSAPFKPPRGEVSLVILTSIA